MRKRKRLPIDYIMMALVANDLALFEQDRDGKLIADVNGSSYEAVIDETNNWLWIYRNNCSKDQAMRFKIPNKYKEFIKLLDNIRW